ncbi:phospholipase C/P1 nuclease family protein [Hymenobacter baengnokdamensis]|uniref:hypothetical protein n=1 Tax=Hymenobacter baengnokdamensis TaxID=2615203 RepID=UPI001247CD9B|nr:hypothetical protein [Hymenobacter baengnokdamensis]
MVSLNSLSLDGKYLIPLAENQPLVLLGNTQTPLISGSLQQVPLAGGGVALRWLRHNYYLRADTSGELRGKSVSEIELLDAGRNQAYAFFLEPKGNNLYRLKNRDGRVLGEPNGLRISGQALSESTSLLLTEFTVDFSQVHSACGLDHRPHSRRPQWDKDTHADVVGWAFEVFGALTNHPEAKRLHDLFGGYAEESKRNDLMKRLLAGLEEADTKPEYSGVLAGTLIFYKHFYNPETKVNYLGELNWFLKAVFELLTDRNVNELSKQTAYSEALRYAQEAATLFARYPDDHQQHLEAAYKLGLALHYVSDLSQPMHAGNMINLPIVYHAGYSPPDWRHANFELCAEKQEVRDHYLIQQGQASWDTVNPDNQEFAAPDMSSLLDKLARKSLSIYRETLKPIMDQVVDRNLTHWVKDHPFDEATVAPILRQALPLGQRASAAFLLLWSRLGAGLVWSPKHDLPCHSGWAPDFFRHGSKTWAVIADQDAHDTRYYSLDGGHNFVRGGTNCFESPSVASNGQELVVAWHAHSSMSLWTGYARCTELDANTNWEHINLSDARIKDYTSPKVIYFNNQFWMIWADYGHCLHAEGDSDGIWCASFDTGRRAWNTPRKIPGISTTHTPALTIQGNQLWMAWTGLHSAEGIFWATTTDLEVWSVQQQTVFVTGSGPGLGCLQSYPYLFWRAPNNEVHYSVYDYKTSKWSFPPAPVVTTNVSSHQDIRTATIGTELLVGWNDAWWPHYLTLHDSYQDQPT